MSAQSPYSFSNFINVLSNNFVVVLLVGLGIFGGFFLGSIWTQNQMLQSGLTGLPSQAGQLAADGTGEQLPPPIDQMPPVTDADHILGDLGAPVVLVEYSDITCPFCQMFHQTLTDIKAEYGDQVAWVYRHFPVRGPEATSAAEASECVAAQLGSNGFFAYLDVLIEGAEAGNPLNQAFLAESAVSVGANRGTFESCLEAGDKSSLVTEQLNGGSMAGITGTPGTIVVTADGPQELIPGALPIEQVRSIIDSYL